MFQKRKVIYQVKFYIKSRKRIPHLILQIPLMISFLILEKTLKKKSPNLIKNFQPILNNLVMKVFFSEPAKTKKSYQLFLILICLKHQVLTVYHLLFLLNSPPFWSNLYVLLLICLYVRVFSPLS